VSDAPIAQVIFTQGHVDHVGGTDAFVGLGTEVVAQRNNLSCQADDARIHRFRVKRSAIFWADAVAKANAFMVAHPAEPAPVPGVPPGQSVPVPTQMFDDHHHGGETADALVVWLPDHGVANVGNLLSALFGDVPNLVTLRGDRLRFALPFIESVQRVIDLEPEVLLTGHFQSIVGSHVGRAEMVRVRDAVQLLHDTVVDRLNNGASIRTLMQEVTLPPELSLGEGYGTVRWAVRSIVEGYWRVVPRRKHYRALRDPGLIGARRLCRSLWWVRPPSHSGAPAARPRGSQSLHCT